MPPAMVCADCVPDATVMLDEPATVIDPAPAFAPQPNGAAPASVTGTSVNDAPLLTRTKTDDPPPTLPAKRVTVRIPFEISADTRFGCKEVGVNVVETVPLCTTNAESEAPQAIGPNVAGVIVGGEMLPAPPPEDGPVAGPTELLIVNVAVLAVASRTMNETPVVEQVRPVVIT